MNYNFKELPWHDAILESVVVDRHKPGEHDVVRISVSWPLKGYPKIIEFRECYALNLQMNFGVVASESILTAECHTKSENLSKIQLKWESVGVHLSDLIEYIIVTNSTNSAIHIYAKYFHMS